MIKKLILLLLPFIAVICAPIASAEAVECNIHIDGVMVNIFSTVIVVCGDGNATTHTTTVTVDPSILSPHL